MLRSSLVLALLATACALLAPRPARASDGAWDDGFPAHHVHGEACGHFFFDGAWHLFPREHVHAGGCGHYLANGRWDYFPSAHRHSFECGHFFWNGVWQLFAPGHVHGDGCGHFHYNAMWNAYPEGHLHRAGCGHVFVDGEWRPGEAAVIPPEAIISETSAVPPPAPASARELEPEIAREPAVIEPRPLPPAPRPPPRPEPPRDRLIVPVSPEEAAATRVVEVRSGACGSGLRAPVVVVVPGRHTHGAGCGHYWYGGRWSNRPPGYGHAHGPGCGHTYWRSGRGYGVLPLPPSAFEGRFRRQRTR